MSVQEEEFGIPLKPIHCSISYIGGPRRGSSIGRQALGLAFRLLWPLPSPLVPGYT